MRRTTSVEPFEPIEPAEPLSHAISGRNALRANPEPINLNPEPAFYIGYVSDSAFLARRMRASRASNAV